MNQITKTIGIQISQLEDAKKMLLDIGGVIVPDRNMYMFSKLRTGEVTVSLYTTGKVVLQGGKGLDKICDSLVNTLGGKRNKISISGSNSMSNQKSTDSVININEVVFVKGMVGADEAGKGEYFGPLVTAACYVPEKASEELMKMGIKDSKKIKDSKIFEMEIKVKKLCVWSVNPVDNERFNKEMKETENISEVMAIAHVKSIKAVLFQLSQNFKNFEGEKPSKVLIDKFTKIESRVHNKFEIDIPVILEEKGERYLSVACASILARAEYLRELEALESKYGKFPRGYNNLNIFIKDFLVQYGVGEWNEIAKTSYKMGKG